MLCTSATIVTDAIIVMYSTTTNVTGPDEVVGQHRDAGERLTDARSERRAAHAPLHVTDHPPCQRDVGDAARDQAYEAELGRAFDAQEEFECITCGRKQDE